MLAAFLNRSLGLFREEFKDRIQHSTKEPKPEVAASEEGDEPTVDSSPDEDGEHRLKDRRELSDKTSSSEVHARLE